jgi:addiction module HigA family antidote
MKTANRRPTSPGEILHEEFLVPLGLTQEQLAQSLGVARRRINEIVKGKRAITVDTAIRLGRFFQMTPQFWLNLQLHLDFWEAEYKKAEEYEKIKPHEQRAEVSQ